MNFTNYRIEEGCESKLSAVSTTKPFRTIRVLADCIENGRTAMANFRLSSRSADRRLSDEAYIAMAKQKFAGMRPPQK